MNDCNCGITIEMPKQNGITINMSNPSNIPIINETIPPIYEYAKYYEEIIEARDTVVNMVAHKQDKLIAGNNISIVDNVISSTYSVPAETIQQITDNKNTINQQQTTIAQQQREIDALIRMQGGAIYNFEKQDSIAHTLDVPSGAKMCDVLEIEGRSYVANQLVPLTPVFVNMYDTPSSATVTFNNNGSITINGTDFNANVFFRRTGTNPYPLTVGHKCLIVCKGSQGNNLYFRIDKTSGTSFVNTTTSDYAIGTTQDIGASWYVHIAGTHNNVTVRPMLIDLTKMFGAGNEPTLEQCQKIFTEYIPYNEGTLENVKTDSVVTKGKNLFDVSRTYLTETEDGAYKSSVSGYDWDFYDNKAGVGHAITDISLVPLYEAGNYTFSAGDVSSSYILIASVSDSGIVTQLGTVNSNGSKTITLDVPTRVTLRRHANGTSTTMRDIQIEKGTVATAYTPYTETTIPILPVVTEAEAKRYKAGAVTDEVDYKNRRMLRKVGRVDLGTLTWVKEGSAGLFRVSVTSIGMAYNFNLTCSKYYPATTHAYSDIQNKGIALTNSETNPILRIRDTDYADKTADEFKASLNGVILYYELATSTTEDLSSIIPSEASVLDCYGAGVNDVTNRIYQADGRWYYEQRVGKVDLGTISWTKTSSLNDLPSKSNISQTIPIKPTTSNGVVVNILAENYTTKIYNVGSDVTDNLGVIAITGRDTLAVNTGSYDIKPSGMMYYELATPITTDITDLIQLQAFKVEAGGTITLHNTDDSSVPISNSVEYATLLKEVARYDE